MNVPDHEHRAAEAFMRRRSSAWTGTDEARLQTERSDDPAFADAWRRVEESWAAVQVQALIPEVMRMREQTFGRTRRRNARRWSASQPLRRWKSAAAIAAVLAGAAALQFSPYGYWPGTYQTAVGEQRTLELDDRSRLTLDAATRVRVRFSANVRLIELLEGQAQFEVAKDSARPFKVRAGGRTVVALGTVFTVEYLDREMRIVMLEGKVALLPASVRSGEEPVPLVAGEGLKVRQDGEAVVGKVDLAAATAWREGKVIFHGERLVDAVRRLNRYSRSQIEIADRQFASKSVSGVFDTRDGQMFVDVVNADMPGAVRLRF